MASRKNVQNAHIKNIRAIYRAVADLTGLMNRPQQDAFMVAQAGISLDRALFPPLVVIGRFGPIGVVDLADHIGRDYTTVSRQVAKLESLGLVERHAGSGDKRMRQSVTTPAGRRMIDAIDKARDRIMSTALADWSGEDIKTLARLLRRVADRALAAKV